MDSNITEQQYLDTDLQLSEPHFEEEATLLSARPVVPLHEVKAEERSGRRLSIGLALVAALVVGALGATLVYKQRSQNATTAIEETTTPVANEQAATDGTANADKVAGGAVAGGIVADPPQAVSGVAENKSETADHDASNAVAARPRKPATVVIRHSDPDKPTAPKRDEAVRDEAVLADEKAARRAERIEARRLRRQAEREALQDGRRRRARRSDDLLRIREIFEGSRRP